MTTPTFNREKKWAKVLKSGLNKFIKGFLPQNLFSPLLNTLSQMTMYMIHKMLNKVLGTQRRIQSLVERLAWGVLRQ